MISIGEPAPGFELPDHLGRKIKLDDLKGKVIMALGAAAVLLYSDVFARAGLGELFAGLGLGALPVWGAAWVQGPEPGAGALWAGIPAFFMTFNLLLLNEFPDLQYVVFQLFLSFNRSAISWAVRSTKVSSA